MKHLLRKIIVTLLICIPIAEVLLSPILLKASDYSDPAITGFVIYPKEPAPASEVDFLVTFSNFGASEASGVILIVDYEENIFKRILVGDPYRCVNTGVSVVCSIPKLQSGEEDNIGFTAYVADNAEMGTNVVSQASIDEPANPDNNRYNDLMSASIVIGRQTKSPSLKTAAPVSEILDNQKILEEPSGKQGLAILDVADNPEWQVNGLITSGLKFFIRGKEALAWSLGIKDSGFHNPAIRENYLKVLTIINSLFIIGLLAIAAMWMFSILIPRRYLRQVMLVYGLAVIFVNFALPLNQLLIDGTGLIQNAFISNINISGIVETPQYNDGSAIGYRNVSGGIKTIETKNLDVSIDGADNEGAVVIGKIEQDFLRPSYTGVISTKDGESVIQLRSTGADASLVINPEQTIGITNEKVFNPEQENVVFVFVMLVLTGIAYFSMALIFILRIVILWALMIISPALFLLAVFRFTRGYFVRWTEVYARWLLIGPIMALGIAIVVGIWKASGMPITSTYAGSGEFGVLTNIGFYLPGSANVNTFRDTSQVMEYILFLVMLYLPIIMAFMLTKQKLWGSAIKIFTEKNNFTQKETSSQKAAAAEYKKEEITSVKAGSSSGGITGFLGSQFSKFTKAAMPESLKNAPGEKAGVLESATSFLPQHLALTSMRDMLDLTAGNAKNSRKSREKAIEYLAHPDEITDNNERRKTLSVRQEINKRVQAGDAEAIRVMDEIHDIEKQAGVPIITSVGNTVTDKKNEVKEFEKTISRKTLDEENKNKKEYAKDAEKQTDKNTGRKSRLK